MLRKLKEHSLWIGALVFVLVAWFFTLLAFDMPGAGTTFKTKPETLTVQDYWQWRGTFGDMFGAVNSLFSALTVVGVGFGLTLQRKELRMAEREAKLARLRERSARGDALKEAQQATERARTQAFQTTFFQLINALDLKVHRMSFGDWTGMMALREVRAHVVNNRINIEALHLANSYLAGVKNILALIETRPPREHSTYAQMFLGSITPAESRLIELTALFADDDEAKHLVFKHLFPDNAPKKSDDSNEE